MLPSVAALGRLSSRRPLYLLICLSVFVLGYVLLKTGSYAVGFYSKGTFVKYHMDMTPTFISEFPTHIIPVQELGYSAVILYLITASTLRELMLSLYYVYTNVPTQPWPIVLFYADDMDDASARIEFMLRLYDFLGGGQDVRHFLSRIEFERLDWSLPLGISPNKVDVDPVYIHAWPGFHLMSGFFATQIFDHPRLLDRNVTYYLRLSPDSYIYKPLCYDPFEIFHARNLSYGYRARSSDPGWLTQGMWAVLDEFTSSRPEAEKNLEKNGWEWPKDREPRKTKFEPFPTYYNTFEMVRLEAFRRPDVREWFEEVDRVPERIYKYRWSDSPIRYATVNMYFDVEKDVEEFCGMSYFRDGVQGDHFCACEDQRRRGR